jgi:hypothetical protein
MWVAAAVRRAMAAMQASTGGTDPCSVEPGSWVCVVLRGVPEAAAATVVARVQACCQGDAGQPPLVAFGLMTHEAKVRGESRGVVYMGGGGAKKMQQVSAGGGKRDTQGVH